MQDKPLDQAELDLLDVIRQLHAKEGPFLRSTLSVIGRGRGLDVARPLNRLKSLGLVVETEHRPGFLKRLFGARTQVLLSPALPASGTASGGAPDAAADLPPPLADPATAPVDQAPEAVEAAPPAAPAPVSAAVTPPPTPPARPIPRPRPVPQGYADDFGGVALDPPAMALAPGLDPALLDDLREMLAVLGMEMTQAGEALISDRIARGATIAEALMQVTLFTFAHAAHYDSPTDAPDEAGVVHDYAVELLRELQKLQAAGEIGAEVFARDSAAILALADRRTDRGPMVAALFADPVGGAAPPALLPEELRGIDDSDETEEG